MCGVCYGFGECFKLPLIPYLPTKPKNDPFGSGRCISKARSPTPSPSCSITFSENLMERCIARLSSRPLSAFTVVSPRFLFFEFGAHLPLLADIGGDSLSEDEVTIISAVLEYVGYFPDPARSPADPWPTTASPRRPSRSS